MSCLWKNSNRGLSHSKWNKLLIICCMISALFLSKFFNKQHECLKYREFDFNQENFAKFEQRSKLIDSSLMHVTKYAGEKSMISYDNLHKLVLETFNIQIAEVGNREKKKASSKSIDPTRFAMVLIVTAIPQLSHQFVMAIHPYEEDIYATPELLTFGMNHPYLTHHVINTVALLRKHDPNGEIFVLDVGANIGYFGLLVGSIDDDNVKVVSCEPTLFHRSLYEFSLTLNPRIKPRVTVESFAIVSHSKTAPKVVCVEMPDPSNAGFSTIRRDTATTDVTSWCPPHLISKTTTVDALVAKHGYPKIIKIDVEGFEMDVLLGATNTFSGVDGPKPTFVILEYNSFTSPLSNLERGEKTVDFFYTRGYIMSYVGIFYTTRASALEFLTKDLNKIWNDDLFFYDSSSKLYRSVQGDDGK